MHIFLQQTTAAASSSESTILVVSLLILGLIFMAAEIFVLPGFGVAGIIGLAALAGGSLAAWLLLGPSWGMLVIGGTITITTILGIFGFRSKAMRKRLVLSESLARGNGLDEKDFTSLIGKKGVAKTELHPAGIVTVDGRRVDVVSQGGFIEKGTEIKITAVDGPRVVVTKIG